MSFLTIIPSISENCLLSAYEIYLESPGHCLLGEDSKQANPKPKHHLCSLLKRVPHGVRSYNPALLFCLSGVSDLAAKNFTIPGNRGEGDYRTQELSCDLGLRLRGRKFVLFLLWARRVDKHEGVDTVFVQMSSVRIRFLSHFQDRI